MFPDIFLLTNKGFISVKTQYIIIFIYFVKTIFMLSIVMRTMARNVTFFVHMHSKQI